MTPPALISIATASTNAGGQTEVREPPRLIQEGVAIHELPGTVGREGPRRSGRWR
jgi:hypothetical protein